MRPKYGTIFFLLDYLLQPLHTLTTRWAAPVQEDNLAGEYALQEVWGGKKSDITLVDYRCILCSIPKLCPNHFDGTVKGKLGQPTLKKLHTLVAKFKDK